MKKSISTVLFGQAEDAFLNSSVSIMESISEKIKDAQTEAEKSELKEKLNACKAVIKRFTFRSAVFRGILGFFPTSLNCTTFFEELFGEAVKCSEIKKIGFTYKIDLKECFAEIVCDRLQFTETVFMMLSYAAMFENGGALYSEISENGENFVFKVVRKNLTLSKEYIDVLNGEPEKLHKNKEFFTDESALFVATLKELVLTHKDVLTFNQVGEDFEIKIEHPKKYNVAKKVLKENKKLMVATDTIAENELLAIKFRKENKNYVD